MIFAMIRQKIAGKTMNNGDLTRYF